MNDHVVGFEPTSVRCCFQIYRCVT